jgi:hypothetical protein
MPFCRDLTPKEQALNDLVRLLAPALTDNRGMAADGREQRFRIAIATLCGPLGPDARLPVTGETNDAPD